MDYLFPRKNSGGCLSHHQHVGEWKKLKAYAAHVYDGTAVFFFFFFGHVFGVFANIYEVISSVC